MSDKNKKSSNKVKTPVFVCSFPNLAKPRAGQDGGKEKYSVAAIFDKNQDLTALKKLAMAAGKEKFGDKWKSKTGTGWPEKFRNPFRDGSDKEDMPGYGDDKIFITFSANTDRPMSMFNKKVERVSFDEARGLFYPGCKAVATVQAYAYDMPQNKGVAFGLLGIQFVGDGERLGGGPGSDESDFDSVDDEDESETSETVSDSEDDDAGF